jgi:branched-chain amino acid transport system ATP-binding protein
MADAIPCLTIRDLAIGYLDEPIVRDIRADIMPGTVTTLIGGNGAGKSTLLKSLFGLTKRFSGEIVFEGAPIHDLPPAERKRRGIGLVPQGRCNFPLMSVKENLEMGTYLLPAAAARRAAERMVELFPMLGRKWREAAGNLSGGEQQILETAMALEAGPRLLLLDEPSLGLSPKMQYEVFETIDGIRRTGVTVILAEQNVLGSLLISDRAIVLELGRMFLDGPARQVMRDPRIREAYLGGDPAGEGAAERHDGARAGA